jgi:hypothetical protein
MDKEKATYNFSADKNRWLIKERDISFEEVIAALDSHGLLDVVEHHNSEKYSHQKMYVVQVNDYVYLVPFVEEEQNTVFLKTIFPSRKAKKRYLKAEVNNES